MTFEINRHHDISCENTLITHVSDACEEKRKNKEKEGRKKEEKQKVGERRVTFGRLSHRCQREM